MNPKMDFSPEKRIAAGDLKNIGSILRDLPEDYKGVVRIQMVREQKTYESDLVLQNGFIIGASIACSEDGARLLGEKAFLGLVDLIKESSGGFAAYGLSDSEFKPYVAANESMLLELVRGLGRILEEIGHVDEDIRKEGLIDLESQWKELESKWKQFEEREKPYLEMILKADLRDRSNETGGGVVVSPEDISESSSVLSSEGDIGKERNMPEPSADASPAPSEVPAQNLDSESRSCDNHGQMDGAGSSDEKNLDDMILREDPWEKVSAGPAPEGAKKEKQGETMVGLRSNAPESVEAAQLRQELRGVFHGADTKEQKAESASTEKTLSDDFNERVRDAILGKTHHRLSENAVSAPKRDQMPSGGQPVKEGACENQNPQPSAHDEWLSRANATLQRLKHKKEEKTSAPLPDDIGTPVADAEAKPVEAPSKTEPSQDTPNRDDLEMGVPSTSDQDDIIEKIKEISGEEWDEASSSEISDLKKEVDVYWGWDKRKKRFVGIDGAEMPASAGKMPEGITETVAPPKSKVPLAQCAVLREELKKQALDAREIVIKKEEVAEALLASQAPQEPPQPDIPLLKKKIGFMDKLKYAKYPQIIKVMEKVDGKKSIDDLAREAKLTPAAVKYIIEKLVSDGYLSMKGAV
jgi:hypothetical protein